MTETQRKVFNLIKEYKESHGFSPTIRELCKLLGVNSTGTMAVHLKQLKKKGYIDYEYRKMRTIKILKDDENGDN